MYFLNVFYRHKICWLGFIHLQLIKFIAFFFNCQDFRFCGLAAFILKLVYGSSIVCVYCLRDIILKTSQEVCCFIVAGLTRMFSVPWGHSVFNATQLTIYWIRYGRLTQAEIPFFSFHLFETFAQTFPDKLSSFV